MISKTLFILLAAGVANGLRLKEPSKLNPFGGGAEGAQKPYALVWAASPSTIKGIVASMGSVTAHADMTKVGLYLFVLDEEKGKFSELKSVNGQPVRQIVFSRTHIDPYLNKVFVRKSNGSHLESPYNFVRYIMPWWLPKVDGMMWIDSDTFVTTDITKTMPEFLESKKVVGAFPRDKLGIKDITLMSQKCEAAGLKIMQGPYFNAGVLFISGAQWRDNGWSAKVKQFVALNNEHVWYTSLASQPPLNLLFGGENLFQLREELHGYQLIGDLGFKKLEEISKRDNLPHLEGTVDELLAVKAIFHWNGKKKPWLEDGHHIDLWQKGAWDLTKCSMSAATMDALQTTQHDFFKNIWDDKVLMKCSAICDGKLDLTSNYEPCECFE